MVARRPWKGPTVNPLCREPSSPGPWVDSRRCAVCGALYDDYRGASDFGEQAQELRGAARSEGDPGGGYRSRGPVLWRMRCAKLTAWYLEHAGCGEGWVGGVPDFLAHLDNQTHEELELAAGALPELWELEGRWVVRGWWTEDDPGDPAWWAVAVHLRRQGGNPWPVLSVEHHCARWGFDGRGGRTLHLIPEGGATRGAFRVTVLEVDGGG